MTDGIYKGSLFERAAERLNLPGEAALKLPVVTITGCRRIHVENHQGIIEYGDEKICINCGKLVLRIEGKGLELIGMTELEILAGGTLTAVCFDF